MEAQTEEGRMEDREIRYYESETGAETAEDGTQTGEGAPEKTGELPKHYFLRLFLCFIGVLALGFVGLMVFGLLVVMNM
ncbi:MAG: hypothetical protein IJR00_09005 [Lachnospiraceae bacterium]|nr:hypothetical protein [Lachnospiraceae bacterium]